MMKKTALSMILALTVTIASANPANRQIAHVAQPDGTTLSLRLIGDEYFHYNTTADGYTVLQNEAGAYVYAQQGSEGLVASTIIAHDQAERTTAEQALLQSTTKHLTAKAQIEHGSLRRAQQRVTKAGFDFDKVRGLVILINLADVSFTMDDPQEFYKNQFNEEGYSGYIDNDGNTVRCTGSVVDYFSAQSNERFKPPFDVYGPVSVNFKSTTANSTARSIFKNALTALDSEIDFTKYDSDGDGKVDMIYFIIAGLSSSFSGNNSGYLWPHASSLSGTYDGMKLDRYACSTELYGWEESPSTITIEGIGTICHEFSHVLGLPDFYDTDYSQSGGESHHPGDWDIMAGGGSFNYARTPVGYTIFERYALGWANPPVITEPGTYTLHAVNTSNEGYIIKSPVDNEFFMLENRQKTNWDAYLPGHGLIVARVDSTNEYRWTNNTINTNPTHNYYELLRAGNTVEGDLASDPFPGTTNNAMITNETSPSLQTWGGYDNTLNLSGICENNGVITFNVIRQGELQTLVEDFEKMTANTSTSDKDVEGNFASWSFNKSGVRAPGDGKCNGTNAVLTKLPSTLYTTTPIYYNAYQASVAVFNPSSYTVKYSLEYSTDGGTTWTKTTTPNGSDGAEVASKTNAIAYWQLDLNNTQPAQFRLAQVSGNKNSSVYIDDFTIYYTGSEGGQGIAEDVNGDGIVSIADINAIISVLIGSENDETIKARADVNNDGIVSVADINVVINYLLSH